MKKKRAVRMGIILFIWVCTSTVIIWRLIPRQSVPQPIDAWATFSHPEYDFSIQYPEKWSVIHSGESGYRGNEDVKLVVSPSLFDSNAVTVRVYYQESENPSLKKAIDWNYERNTFNGFVEYIDSQEKVIGNTRVFQNVFQIRERTFHEYYFARDNSMFIISFRCESDQYSSYAKDFEIMANSLIERQ